MCSLKKIPNAELHLFGVPWGSEERRDGIQVPLQHHSQLNLKDGYGLWALRILSVPSLWVRIDFIYIHTIKQGVFNPDFFLIGFLQINIWLIRDCFIVIERWQLFQKNCQHYRICRKPTSVGVYILLGSIDPYANANQVGIAWYHSMQREKLWMATLATSDTLPPKLVKLFPNKAILSDSMLHYTILVLVSKLG